MADSEAGTPDRADAPEPHLPDIEPVPSSHREDEKITDARSVALLFLVFLLLLALMYQLAPGR